MANDWQALTELTQGKALVIERVRLAETGVRIEGEFEPPALAALSAQDQVFVAAFVRSHGSIKQMEKLFGVSYPTIKSRLNRIAAQLEFVQVEAVEPGSDVLERLERGEISVAEALEMLER